MRSFFENDSMVITGIVVLFSCISVLIFYLAVRQRRKLREHFAVFAERLGCPASIPESFFGGFPSINGEYRKRPLRVYMFTRSSGSGKNRRSTTYTAFTIEVKNEDGFEFHVYEQGFFSTLMIKFGMQDIQVGDEAFDSAFIVKSNSDEKIRSILTPTIMAVFMDLAKRYTAFGVQLKGQGFHYEAPVTITGEKSMRRFEDMINLVCDIADQLDDMNRHRKN